MGRDSTGACTTAESLRIELPTLKRLGFLRRGLTLQGPLSWTNSRGEPSGNITLSVDWSGSAPYALLTYTVTTPDGQKTAVKDRVELVEVTSNLGRGSTLYFRCPATGGLCRVLYKAYGSLHFRSRKAFPRRLYYPAQISTKKGKANDTYWRLDAEIKKAERQPGAHRRYRGKLTKRAQRLEHLRALQRIADAERWSTDNLPAFLQKAIRKGLF
jgi:hypothetical protein